jgi:hypothetical protein
MAERPFLTGKVICTKCRRTFTAEVEAKKESSPDGQDGKPFHVAIEPAECIFCGQKNETGWNSSAEGVDLIFK